MTKSRSASKLVELRAKTDRELLILLERELNRALVLAKVAATRESPLFTEAARAYESATKLLHTVPDRGRERPALLEATLKELRATLESVPAHRVRVPCLSASGSAI